MLVDRDPARAPATVPGWRVVALPDVVYPGLIPDPASTATGELLTDLTPDEWRVIGAFESPRYELVPLTATDGRAAYGYADTSGQLTAARDWDVRRFADAELPAYLARCVQWRQRHEASAF